MDLSVRDWLIIIGALLAIAVLLDGFRRMRNERKDTLRLASKKRREAEEELINPELPGEARVVAVREAPSLHQRDASQKHRPQASHDDDDVLMRDYSAPETTQDSVAETPVEPDSEPALGKASTAEPAIESDEAFTDEAVSAPRRVEREPAPRQSEKPAASEPQELIVLNVVADEGKPYAGADLLQVLLACDLRYGRMNIFHRFEKADGSGAEQFSVANLVEPGNFDLDAIDGFSTPGVVFFMNMPGPEDSMQAFDAMLETARCLVKNLGGELRDQTHSVATKQTLEHYRQIIRDFERRQLTLM
ncbi:MAG: cell division protein ZipA [Spongiibacter marinus]|uniref:cell division protein ZipA n=1 Tax=Spongiibacter marinus TaxID=354246 RepID=UPI003C61232E